MAIIGNTFVDLIDIYKQEDSKGAHVPVIEMLSQLTPFTQDALAVECNKGCKHLTTVRSGLPDVTWGRLYKGIAQSKSTTTQVEDTTGFVEGMSTVDERLLKISKNANAVRLSEGMSFMESMAQEVSAKIFYGNTASDPEEFMGLSPRYNDKSAPNGGQIVDAGGVGSDNTSIWLVTHGDQQTHLLYPEGTQAGVVREDKGSQRVLDGAGNPYFAMEELFTWNIGLTVRDWRYNARIANIDVSEMQDGNVALYDFLRKAYYKLQSRRVPGGRQVMYCNRDVLEALDALANNGGASDSFVRLTRHEVEGAEVLKYRGMEIRETDALLNTEAQVV